MSSLPGKTFTSCYTRDRFSQLLSYALQMKFRNTPHTFTILKFGRVSNKWIYDQVVWGVKAHFHKLCIFTFTSVNNFLFCPTKKTKDETSSPFGLSFAIRCHTLWVWRKATKTCDLQNCLNVDLYLAILRPYDVISNTGWHLGIR